MSEFRSGATGGAALDGSTGALDMLTLDPVETTKAAARPAPKPAASQSPRRASNEIMPWKFPITVDRSRDALLTDFGRDTRDDRDRKSVV